MILKALRTRPFPILPMAANTVDGSPRSGDAHLGSVRRRLLYIAAE